MITTWERQVQGECHIQSLERAHVDGCVGEHADETKLYGCKQEETRASQLLPTREGYERSVWTHGKTPVVPLDSTLLPHVDRILDEHARAVVRPGRRHVLRLERLELHKHAKDTSSQFVGTEDGSGEGQAMNIPGRWRIDSLALRYLPRGTATSPR